jgi:hypothetical protein
MKEILINEITNEQHNLDLKNVDGSGASKYISPSGEYIMKLTFEGQYPHGDFHHYCEIIDSNQNKIWEYKQGDKIRQISSYPWSPDNKTIYFSLIENGNKIVSYNIVSKIFQIIFETINDNTRINWINFIPQTFNGVVIRSDVWINKTTINEYFIKSNDNQISLDLYFKDKHFPCPSNIIDCIYVIHSGRLSVFNIVERKIILEINYLLFEEGYSPIYTPYFIRNTGETLLTLKKDNEYKYLKIYS